MACPSWFLEKFQQFIVPTARVFFWDFDCLVLDLNTTEQLKVVVSGVTEERYFTMCYTHMNCVIWSNDDDDDEIKKKRNKKQLRLS
jgi:hypothetical protein